MLFTAKTDLTELEGKQGYLKDDTVYLDQKPITKLELGDFYQTHHQKTYPVVITRGQVNVITFVELYGKSDYSMLDSMAKVPDIVAKSEVGCGVADHGNMYAIYDFDEQMYASGKKALNGYEMYIKTKSKDYDHLVLLAKNLKGYYQLVKLASMAASRLTVADSKSSIARPYNHLADLKQVDISTLICITGATNSRVAKDLIKHQTDSAKQYLRNLQIVFKDDLYLETQMHHTTDNTVFNTDLINLSQELGIKMVLTNDFHMINANDLDSLQLLQTIGMKKQVGKSWTLTGDNWYLHTSQEVENWDVPTAYLDNTIEVFNKIERYRIYVKENYMPEFILPDGFKTQDEYFEYLTKKGLDVRLNHKIPQEYQERLDHEIGVIEEMGFSGYFLIVADFINYAKRNYAAYDKATGERWQRFIKKMHLDPSPIAIGPGRGSAAGSLVAYSMYITEIDPLKYDLLFERFLNPERVSMPDIDVDIPDNKREEILDYVRDYYNHGDTTHPIESHVAGIAVFGTLKVKSSIKAVVRGLYDNASLGNQIANAAGDDAKTITEARETPDMQNLLSSDKRVDEVLNYAEKLNGVVSNLSQHASGYVMAPKPIASYVPVTFAYSNKSGKMEMLTAYTGIEANGLIKMDFLGLRSMTIINDAINAINSATGKSLTFETILKDAPTDYDLYKYLKQGSIATGDIFQLASSGMTDLMVNILSDVDDTKLAYEKAANGTLFDRIIAGIAMYRPGPMAYIPDFIKNCLNPAEITYAVPQMKDLLKSSFGLLIYQESIMALLRTIAGFTLGGADVARRIIGHKKPEELPALKKTFFYGDGNKIPGGLKLGHTERELEDLWQDIKTFAAYGFNKSHAAAYSHVALAMVYLAYYYPPYFASANLNHAKDADDLATLIRLYRSRKLHVVQASVNDSRNDFVVKDNNIVFGLAGIRKVSSKATAIANERQTNGEFTDYYNFLVRMARNQTDTPLNKGTLLGLIYAGALDEFTGTRLAKVEAIDKTTQLFSLLKKEPKTIFDETTPAYFDTYLQLGASEYDRLTLLNYEHYYTGFYLSGHPVAEFNNVIEGLKDYITLADLKPDTKSLQTVGIISNIHKIFTKNHESMAFVTIEDQTGETEMIVFPETFKDCGRYLKEQTVIIVTGSVDEKGKLLVTNILPAQDQLFARDIASFQVDLSKFGKNAGKILEQIIDCSQAHNVGVTVPLTYLYQGKAYQRTKRYYRLKLSNDLATIDEVQQLVGKNNFTVVWKSAPQKLADITKFTI